jgi:hypothetical protein
MKHTITLFFITIITFSSIYAQDNYRINLKSRQFIPRESVKTDMIEQGVHNLIIQFYNNPSRDEIERILHSGIKINGQLSSNTLSVYVENINQLKSIENLRWIGKLQPSDKISSKLISAEGEIYVVASFHYSLKANDYKDEITSAGGIIVYENYPGENELLIKTNSYSLSSLAEIDAIAYLYPASSKLINGEQVFKCPGAMGEFGYIPDFVTQGNGWDGPGLGIANLKYHFISGTPDVNGEEAEVLAALKTWGMYAQINFSSTASPNQDNSLDIFWGTLEHGCGFPFNGSDGPLAHAFYPDDTHPEPIAGDMHFNDDYLWKIGSDFDVYTVALHEAGHSLGLNHSDDTSAIMYAFYNEPVADLRQDDINGIRVLYASRNTPRTSSPVFDPPSGTYPSPLEVRLNYGSGSNFQNTRIYYTLNGSEPTPYSFEFVPGDDYIFQRYSNTIKARAFRIGHLPSTVVSATYDLQQANPTVQNPVISPPGGTYNQSVQVSISCPTEFAVIRYTLDGTEPTLTSTAYTSPITLNSSAIVRAKAFRDNYTPSQTVSAGYNINTTLPVPSVFPEPGVYSQPILVHLSTTAAGAQIYYTTDGSIPSTSSNIYNAPLIISQTTLLKAITYLNGNSSEVFTGWYNININSTAPEIDPNGGEFTGSVSVSLSTTTPNGIIRYTTNGSEPTSFSTIYTSPINLGVGEHVIKAKTFHQSFPPSITTTANFIVYEQSAVQVATPEITPHSTQTFVNPIPVTITCATEGALIRYTVGFDELPPDPEETGAGSITYNGPFLIGAAGQNLFIKVRAFKDGLAPSQITQTGMLSVVTPLGVVATPEIIPNGGVFYNNIQVTIQTSTPSAQIIYTRDGSGPNSYLPILPPTFNYNVPFSLFQSSVIKAKGMRTFFSDSDVAEAEFIFRCGKPEIEPDSGSFDDTVSVLISTVTNNAVIRYTLDGSEPTDSSALYNGQIVLTPGNYVIKAKAFRTNYESSETSVAQITVNEPATLPVILTHPDNQSVNIGETAVFFVEVEGLPNPSIQWMRNDVALPWENADSLILENVQPGDAGEYKAKVFNPAGEVYSNPAQLTVKTTSADEIILGGIPDDFEFKGNYPNPFNPSTKISFGIPEESDVRINIYNIMGELVEILIDDVRSAGYYERIWNATDYASGIYLVKIDAKSLVRNKSFSKVHKLLLIK